MWNTWWICSAVLSAVLGAAAWSVAAPVVQVETLERVPAGARVQVSPGGAYRCYYVKAGKGAEIYVNGRRESISEALFRDCACEGDGHIDFQFSSDGARYAYLIKRHDRNVVMINGKEMPGSPPNGWFTLSPGGMHYWFREGALGLVVDGVHYAGDADDIAVSPDDREWAVAMVNRDTERATLLRNGNAVFTADGIGAVSFLPDGRLCWTALTRPENRERWDTTGWKNEIYLEGKRIADVEWDVCTDLATSTPDGRHVAFTLVEDPAGAHRATIMVDGKKSRPYPGGIERLDLAPDGSHLALFTRHPTEYRVIFNHMVGPAFRRVWAMSFSPSGKHYVYFGEVKPDEWVLVVDGGKPWALPGKTFPCRVAWTVEERPLPVFQSRDQRFVTAGDRTYGPYSPINRGGVRVAADGRCVYPVYAQGQTGREGALYLDGAPLPGVTFSALTDDYRIAGSRITATLIRRLGEEQELLRVTISLPDVR